MTDEEAKKQFLIFAALRLVGVALFLAGVAIAFSDWLQPGGWPLLGGILAVTGAIEAVVAPRLVKRGLGRR